MDDRLDGLRDESSRAADSPHSKPPSDDSGSDWPDWPVCPQCGRRRQAVCLSCEIAGTDFPLADFVAPTAPVQRPWRAGEGGLAPVDRQGQPILLMCPICDEAFAPRFYRHCEACGHDFGSGVQTEAFSRESFNARAAVVIFGLILLGVGLLIYFAMLLRN
jgi:hypothetical protein